jgi:hypothetical protein
MKMQSIPQRKTHYVSTRKINEWILFRETIAVYCENRTKHTSTLSGRDENFQYVKAGGTYSNQGFVNC